MAAKEYAGLEAIKAIVDNVKSRFSLLGHKHTASDITDLEIPTYELTKDGSTITLVGSNGTSTAVTDDDTKITVDSSLSGSSANPVENKVVHAALEQKVPTTRKINNKALSADITLSASDVGADASGTATTAVSSHNTNTEAHNDIRLLIIGLTNKLNALADSDDTTLDQMSEVVAYIKSNKDLIDSITTSKVNVTDIVNNLTTNVSNKPLSAAQGVAIKNLIDALQTEVDAKALASDLASHTSNTSNPHKVTAEQIGLGNVDNTSDTNKPVSTAQAKAISDAVSAHNASTEAHADIREMIVQSDLNQNDETALDYVKNRTHWIDDEGTYHPLDEQYVPDTIARADDLVGKNVTGLTLTTLDYLEVKAAKGAEIFNNYDENVAVGLYSHAEGYHTSSENTGSHTEGIMTQATGEGGHAEGKFSKCWGIGSHSEGYQNAVYEDYGHAEGNTTMVFAIGGHTEGSNTTASGEYQHVQGKYNIEDSDSKYAHIVGNGTARDACSNAHTVDWDGLGWFAGGLKVGGTGQDDETAVEVATTTYVDDAITNNVAAPFVFAGSAPSSTKSFWIDTAKGNLLKAYNPSTSAWEPISAAFA